MIDPRRLVELQTEMHRLRVLESKCLVEAGREMDPARKVSLEADGLHWKEQADAVHQQICAMVENPN